MPSEACLPHPAVADLEGDSTANQSDRQADAGQNDKTPSCGSLRPADDVRQFNSNGISSRGDQFPGGDLGAHAVQRALDGRGG
jgi:hypothetical protein